MKHFIISHALPAAIALAFVTGACSDDETVKVPLSPATGLTSSGATYQSISFSWNAVDGAQQYGVQLLSASGSPVETIVTQKPEATFSGLDYDTEYQVKIWAYAFINSDKTTSEPVVLTAKTTPLTPVTAPVISNDTKYDFVFSWDWDNNVDEYTYQLSCNGELVEEGTLDSDSSVTFTNGTLPEGEYTLEVEAITSEPGYCNNHSSIQFQGGVHQAYSLTGTYTSQVLGSAFEATIVAMSDYTYQLLGWYGVMGFNLDFSTASKASVTGITILNDITPNASGQYSVPTGLESPAALYVQPTKCKKTERSSDVTLSFYIYNPNTKKWITETYKANF